MSSLNNVGNKDGNTLLHIIMLHEENECKAIQKTDDVLSAGRAKINSKNYLGEAPLHIAAISKHYNVTEHLIDKGANLNVRNNFIETPLHLAIKVGNDIMVQLLLRKGANPGIQNSDGDTPLHLAVRVGTDKQVTCLLQHGARVSMKNKAGNTCLHDALQHMRSNQTFKILMNTWEDVNVKNCNGDTPLHIAIKLNRAECTQMLLDWGAELSVRNASNKTPYELAEPFSQSGRLLQDHFTKLKMIKWPVDMEIVEKNSWIKQLERMEAINVYEHISLLSALLNCSHYIKNNQVLQELEEIMSCPESYLTFPSFFCIFRKILVKAKNHMRLFNLAFESLSSDRRQTTIRFLPNLVKEKILSYLSDEELEVLIRSDGFWFEQKLFEIPV